MSLTASSLRANIYKVLDEVLETGVPVEISRRGRILRIVPAESTSRLERLVRRPDVVAGSAAELVDVSWEHEWSPDEDGP